MDYIKGVTFGYLSQRGEWETEEARSSLRLLKERCAASHVILAVVVEQDTIHSTTVNWQKDTVLSDEEVVGMAAYAHELGLEVILKPMVNVSDGQWRALINFFDHDEPCEPKWSDWFVSYTNFMTHYAALAEKTNCEMLVIGCEMVNSDRREKEWREVIAAAREEYSGLITYNCDKYQENHLSWRDAVDVISSSGYYPIDSWVKQLSRIQKVVQREGKPFFFCEAGCASRKGAKDLPNNWELEGSVDLDEQREWYEEMFRQVEKESWIQGFGLWDWKARLYSIEKAKQDTDYALYGKPAEIVVKNFFEKI